MTSPAAHAPQLSYLIYIHLSRQVLQICQTENVVHRPNRLWFFQYLSTLWCKHSRILSSTYSLVARCFSAMKCVRKHCLNTKYGTSATTAFSSPTSKATRSAKQTTRDEETANPEGEKKQNKEEKKNLKGKNKKKHLTVVYESFADPS